MCFDLTIQNGSRSNDSFFNSSIPKPLGKPFENAWLRFQMYLLCKSNLQDKTMVIIPENFPKSFYFLNQNSLGLKFQQFVNIFSSCVKNSPVETSKKEIPIDLL
jgi:hypothetical protein